MILMTKMDEIMVAINTAIVNPSNKALIPIIEDTTLCISDEDAYISDLTSDESSDYESPEVRALVNCQRRSKKKEAIKRSNLTIGFHHGQLQMLPSTWTFPRMNCKQLVDNWYVGNRGGKGFHH